MDTKQVQVPAGIGATMLYIEANKHIPTGRVSSSARKGRKWFDDLMVGEVFRCVNKDTGTLITRAVCVRKELVTYREVLLTAFDNHVAFENEPLIGHTPNSIHSKRLERALTDAYGVIDPEQAFTKIHMMPLLDWAEDNVRSLYYAARWQPDRVVDADRLWKNVRDTFGFKPGETDRRLGPATWEERYANIKNTTRLRRDAGHQSVNIGKQDFIDMEDRNLIDWLRMPGGAPAIPTFLGLVVDRLEQ